MSPNMRKKLPGIVATILFVAGLLFAFVFLWMQSKDNERENERQQDAIERLVEQRNSAKEGAAAAVDTAQAANDKLQASGQSPVQIPQSAISAARGATGAPGSPGADGQPGPQGEPGRDGQDGTDGAPGPQGTPGRDGNDGADGATGATGSSGQNGADGSAGAAGADGQPGPQGVQGEQGPQGIPGTNGTNGEPPVSWTYTDTLGATYTCSRVVDFDANSPRYTCAADGGAVTPTPTTTEGNSSDAGNP